MKITLLHPDAIIPTRKTPGASGYDLHTCDSGYLPPGTSAVLSTGVAFAIPEGYEGQVRPRSNTVHRLLGLITLEGTIDSDYRGAVKVSLFNAGPNPVRIAEGERIAQIVFSKVEHFEFEQVDLLGETVRGDGGFGHTKV